MQTYDTKENLSEAMGVDIETLSQSLFEFTDVVFSSQSLEDGLRGFLEKVGPRIFAACFVIFLKKLLYIIGEVISHMENENPAIFYVKVLLSGVSFLFTEKSREIERVEKLLESDDGWERVVSVLKVGKEFCGPLGATYMSLTSYQTVVQ